MGIRASRPMGRAAILPSLTHRRTVSGCNPRRLATSPDRSNLVFSVLITRIDYLIYVNLSTVVHPAQAGGTIDRTKREEHCHDVSRKATLSPDSPAETRHRYQRGNRFTLPVLETKTAGGSACGIGAAGDCLNAHHEAG